MVQRGILSKSQGARAPGSSNMPRLRMVSCARLEYGRLRRSCLCLGHLCASKGGVGSQEEKSKIRGNVND